MESRPENPQPQNSQYIKDLQPNVLRLLKEISALMAQTKNNLRQDASGKKYGFFGQEVNQAIRNVANLELRMAIVAPMKAGKSTIINAIVGQDLLPSRNAAMTTIPTKITFNEKREKPVLVLDQEIISIFAETWENLQKQMNILGTEVTLEKIAQYPHLKDLAAEIAFNPFDIPPEIIDRENISLVLTKLNDIVRLNGSLDPNQDTLARLIDVPCLETPFWHNEATQDSQYLGKLVIIDTPGPNEARDSEVLTAVVEKELKQSSIVLIVLDFTQLNNQAAEDVKKQVQPVINLIGKENLYVLVNKVDQRRPGDMTKEQVKEFVYADLNLSESSDSDRIFEVSARQAFSATKFLLELQNNPEIDIHRTRTGTAIAREVLGIDWKKDLENITLEELQTKANKLLHESGFTPFLKQAIQTLREDAAIKCISSALNRCYGLLGILKNDLNLRINIISQDTQKIEQAIASLALDLENFESCCTRISSVDEFEENLQANLSESLNQLKTDSFLSIDKYVNQKNYQSDEDNLLHQLIVDKLQDSSDQSIGFLNQNEANNFVIQAVAWSKIYSENQLQIGCQNLDLIIKQSQQELSNFLNSETRDVIAKAKPLLNQDFDLKLSFTPSPRIQAQLGFIPSQVDTITKEITDYEIETYRPWYFLWLIQLKRKIPVIKTESFYTVSLQAIAQEVNILTEDNIRKISEAIYQYLNEEFRQPIDSYFAELEQYFSSYRDRLIEEQKAQELALVEKTQWVQQLNVLVLEAEQKLTETDSCIQQTKQYL